jgi:hypothetical protein
MYSNFFKISPNQKTVNFPRAKTNDAFTLVFGMFSIVMLFAVASTSYSFAESQTTVQLNDELNLEETVITMSIPADNVLPWGAVWGTVDDPAQGYPVIIQFFNEENGADPIHVAQVGVKGDDTYEYKFRVRNVDPKTGEATNIFEGDYTVKIFKVVNSPHKELGTI